MKSPKARSEPGAGASLSDYVFLTLGFAMVAAMLEGALLLVLRFAFDQVVHVSPYVIWMMPLSYLLFFSVAALLFAGISRFLPRPISTGAVSSAFGFLCAFCVLLVLEPKGIHILAILLLSLGIGVTIARVARGRSHGRWVLSRLAVLALWGLVPLVVLVQGGLRSGGQGREFPNPAPSESPNVLLLVLDTVRAMSLGLYGNEQPTSPEIDAFFRTGVVFDRALVTAPWTLPSHGSMFTGRYPHELSATWDLPLDDTYPTIAEALSANGYATAGFVANLVYVSRNFGLNRGFEHYDDFPISLGQVVASSSPGRMIAAATWLRRLFGYHELLNRRSAADLNRALLAWLDETSGRPFFAFVNYFDAHEPYLPPADLARAFEARPEERPVEQWITPFLGTHAEVRSGWTLTAEQKANGLASYEAAIASIDREIGSLLRELERRGELERTIVILTSDHGEQHGEHGLIGHVNSVYMPLLHVPLSIVHPSSVPAGVRIGTAVTLADLPATILDLTGVGRRRPDRETQFPGRSLAAHWEQLSEGASEERAAFSQLTPGPVLRGWYPVAKGALESIVSEGYHYIESEEGAPELYNLLEDPSEEQNVAEQADMEPVLDRLRTRLRRVTR